MKKNKMMRLASVLLVAVLLTTCAISGTWAKYTTTASGSSSARVAKWGFNTTELTFDLFDGPYNNVANKSGDGKNVIAPGTEDYAEIILVPDTQVANSTEVAYDFDVNVSIEGNAALISKIMWKLNDAAEYGTFAELQAAINDMYDNTYAAGELPANDTIKLSWQWAYDSGDNEGDTDLGEVGTAEVEVTLTFTATQKD